VQLEDRPLVQGEIDIAAPAPLVWRLVTDLDVLAACSPELVAAAWEPPAVTAGAGARFTGRNVRGDPTWETTCTVSDLHAPHVFSFAVGDPADPVATWRYQLYPTRNGGTHVAESVLLGTAASPLTERIAADPEREDELVAGRAGQLRAGIETTLVCLAARAESLADSDPESLRRLATQLHPYVDDETGSSNGVANVLAGLADAGALEEA